MSDVSTIGTIEHNGFTVTSNDTSSEELRKNFTAIEKQAKADKAVKEGKEPEKTTPQEAGKKGGESTAALKRKEAREAKRAEAEAAKEKPEAEEKVEAKAEEPEEKAEEEKPEPRRANPRHDPEARVRQATSELAEERRARERDRYEFEQRLRAIEQGKEAKPEQKARPEGKPQPNDFGTYDEYLDARDDWNRQQWTREIEHRQQAQSYGQSIVAAVQQYSDDAQKFTEENPGWQDDISEEVGQLRPSFMLDRSRERPGPSNVIADEVIYAGKIGPEIQLYLSDHPEELQRLSALRTPQEIQIEMRVLARSLAAATAGTSARTEPSRAKAPLPPVKGTPPVAKGPGYQPGMSLDDYARNWKPAKR